MVGMLRTPYFRRDLIVLLHVALGDQNAALILGGELVHDGGYHAAGTAPFGPEVDDHRLIACDQRFEIVFVDCQCHCFVFFVDYKMGAIIKLQYCCGAKIKGLTIF